MIQTETRNNNNNNNAKLFNLLVTFSIIIQTAIKCVFFVVLFLFLYCFFLSHRTLAFTD